MEREVSRKLSVPFWLKLMEIGHEKD